MGLNLTALAANEATVNVDFMGQSASVTYRPSALTQKRLQRLAKQQDDEKALNEFFTELVTDWDVTKGKAKVPLTAEGLSDVPILFLRAVMAAIMEAADSGEAGRLSNAG